MRTMIEIFKAVAAKPGVSVGDVQAEITADLQAGSNSTDSCVLVRRDAIPTAGAHPTLEEVIRYLAQEVSRRIQQ